MRVFISWSGDTSKAVAAALHDWIPNVLQYVGPWLSNHDIPSGSRWSQQLGSQLQDLKTGVLCLTPDNLNAPWILFEAGALSKALDDSLVCPYLFGIETAEVQWPLAQFQLEKAEEDGTRRLMTTINNAAGDAKLSEARFNQSFDMWWPKLRDQLRGIKPSKASVPKRDDRELLEEILGTVRTIRRNTQYDSAFEQLYSLSPVLKQLRGGTRQEEAVDLQ